MLGRIIWINQLKGYGEIRDGLEKSHYFMISENKQLKEGDLVSYNLSEEIKLFGINKAVQVTKLVESRKTAKGKRSIARDMDGQ